LPFKNLITAKEKIVKKIHSQYPLEISCRDFSTVQEIIDRLHKIPRTGWVDHGVKNPETVGEHIDAVVALSEKYFNIAGLNWMLKVHDWPESDPRLGDRRTDRNCPKKSRWSNKKLFREEFRAMRKICLSLKNMIKAKEFFSLWLEFAQNETELAKIANQLDKFQAISQAVKYQKQGWAVDPWEFIDTTGKIITNFILKKELEKIKSELRQNQNAP
jgi:putative hydrolase of HD superfamily